LSHALEPRTSLLEALRSKYRGKLGRYAKADTVVKNRIKAEIDQIKRGSLPDDGWMDEEIIQSYWAYLPEERRGRSGFHQVNLW
jgi:hypothetical protein